MTDDEGGKAQTRVNVLPEMPLLEARLDAPSQRLPDQQVQKQCDSCLLQTNGLEADYCLGSQILIVKFWTFLIVPQQVVWLLRLTSEQETYSSAPLRPTYA